MRYLIRVGALYRHYKGFTVKILLKVKHTETLEDLYVYKHTGKDGASELWARPASMFYDYIPEKGCTRFTPIEELDNCSIMSGILVGGPYYLSVGNVLSHKKIKKRLVIVDAISYYDNDIIVTFSYVENDERSISFSCNVRELFSNFDFYSSEYVK